MFTNCYSVSQSADMLSLQAAMLFMKSHAILTAVFYILAGNYIKSIIQLINTLLIMG